MCLQDHLVLPVIPLTAQTCPPPTSIWARWPDSQLVADGAPAVAPPAVLWLPPAPTTITFSKGESEGPRLPGKVGQCRKRLSVTAILSASLFSFPESDQRARLAHFHGTHTEIHWLPRTQSRAEAPASGRKNREGLPDNTTGSALRLLSGLCIRHSFGLEVHATSCSDLRRLVQVWNP